MSPVTTFQQLCQPYLPAMLCNAIPEVASAASRIATTGIDLLVNGYSYRGPAPSSLSSRISLLGAGVVLSFIAGKGVKKIFEEGGFPVMVEGGGVMISGTTNPLTLP